MSIYRGIKILLLSAMQSASLDVRCSLVLLRQLLAGNNSQRELESERVRVHLACQRGDHWMQQMHAQTCKVSLAHGTIDDSSSVSAVR